LSENTLGKIRGKIIGKLMELGLSQNEARAYEALLELDVAAPLDIATFSGIPISRIYFILSELEKKGLVETQGGRPKLYRAIDPEKALYILTEKYFKAKEEALHFISRLSTEKRSVGKGSFWTIRGRKSIIERIKDIIEDASYSLAAASIDTFLTTLNKNIWNAVQRGVNTSMVIYSTNESATTSLVNKFKNNAMIRIRSVMAPSVFIADDRIGIAYIPEYLYRGRKEKRETALLIENEEFLPILGTYYRYFLWYPSKPVTSPEDLLSRPRTYCLYYRAVEDAKFLLSRGIKVKVKATGRFIGDDRKETTLEGWITDVYESPDKIVYNITVVTDDGRKYVLGGRRCVLEDFETERITLIPSQ